MSQNFFPSARPPVDQRRRQPWGRGGGRHSLANAGPGCVMDSNPQMPTRRHAVADTYAAQRAPGASAKRKRWRACINTLIQHRRDARGDLVIEAPRTWNLQG